MDIPHCAPLLLALRLVDERYRWCGIHNKEETESQQQQQQQQQQHWSMAAAGPQGQAYGCYSGTGRCLEQIGIQRGFRRGEQQ